MATGTVKWFSNVRGYGFIVPDSGGEDLFVHYTGIAAEGFKTLDQGDRVAYEVREGRRGPEAFAVVRIAARASERRARRREEPSRPHAAPDRRAHAHRY
jgi:CspA family cold shock protein